MHTTPAPAVPACHAGCRERWPWMQALAAWMLGLLLLVSFGAVEAASKNKAVYDYYLTGSGEDVVLPAPRTPSAVLMGAARTSMPHSNG